MAKFVIAPQLATLVAEPPKGSAWLHEIKFDGFRMLVQRRGETVRIFSRNGLDWTARFPSIVTAAKKIKANSFLLDSEAVVLNDKGVSSFALMQDAVARGDDSRTQLIAFDLLELDGTDLRSLPLVDRKASLERLLRAMRNKIRYSEHFAIEGAELLSRACAMGLEGIISKRRDAPYASGRNLDWQKSKCLLRQEFVIVGFWDRSDAKNDFGSLALAAHERGQLVFTGKVGTGWDSRTRKAIYGKLTKLVAKTPPVKLPKGVSATGLHWVKPKLVGEVAFTEWTNDGLIRHPSFQGLREDKSATDVVIERPAGTPGLKTHSDWSRPRKRHS